MGAQMLARNLREFPLIAQKCICCLATKQTVTVMHELAQHLTDKQNDGLLRRPLKPREKVKGIEELEAEEQCLMIAARGHWQACVASTIVTFLAFLSRAWRSLNSSAG